MTTNPAAPYLSALGSFPPPDDLIGTAPQAAPTDAPTIQTSMVDSESARTPTPTPSGGIASALSAIHARIATAPPSSMIPVLPPSADHSPASNPDLGNTVSLPAGAFLQFGDTLPERLRSGFLSDMTAGHAAEVFVNGGLTLSLPPGWSLTKWDSESVDAAGPSRVPFSGRGLRTDFVPFVGTYPNPYEHPPEFKFYASRQKDRDYTVNTSYFLTSDGATTAGGGASQGPGAARPIRRPGPLVPGRPTAHGAPGQLTLSSRTSAAAYRELTLGASSSKRLPTGPSLVTYVAQVAAEGDTLRQRLRTPLAPSPEAIRRLAYALGPTPAMYSVLRMQFRALAGDGDRRDVVVPSRPDAPVYPISAVLPLFHSFDDVAHYITAAATLRDPLAESLLSTAIFVLGESDPDVLNAVRDFESGVGGDLDNALFKRLKEAQRQVAEARLRRSKQWERDMVTPSDKLRALIHEAPQLARLWSAAPNWSDLAARVAEAAHDASVADVMSLLVYVWRPTPATYALGPAQAETGGPITLTAADNTLPQERVDEILRGVAAQEVEVAATRDDVAGRLWVRGVLAPACLSSIFGAPVRMSSQDQTVSFQPRQGRLTLTAGEDGIDPTLRGARGQAALWAEVMRASGLTPRWKSW